MLERVPANAPVAATPATGEATVAQGAALRELMKRRSLERLVVGERSVSMVQAAPAEQIRAHAPTMEEETLVAFARNGKRSGAPVLNGFGLKAPLVLFRDRDWGRLMSSPCGLEAGWRRFHELYPAAGGITYVGSVGLSGDRNQALTYLMTTAGPGKSTRQLVYLERREKTWTVSAWIDL